MKYKLAALAFAIVTFVVWNVKRYLKIRKESLF